MWCWLPTQVWGSLCLQKKKSFCFVWKGWRGETLTFFCLISLPFSMNTFFCELWELFNQLRTSVCLSVFLKWSTIPFILASSVPNSQLLNYQPSPSRLPFTLHLPVLVSIANTVKIKYCSPSPWQGVERVGVEHGRISPGLPLYFCHSAAQAPHKSQGN